MTTYQFRIGDLNLQTGAGDVLAAYSIARGVSGWMGGLEGFKAWHQACSRWLGMTNFASDIEKLPIKESSLEVALLTNGRVKILNDETSPAFGTSNRLGQWIAANLCALAFVCGQDVAVQLLLEGMIPNALPQISKDPILKDNLQTALQDHLSQILNEGGARKLTDKFMEVTAGLPPGDLEHMRGRTSGLGKESRKVQMETDFVAGFLWWLTSSDDSEPYLTRSGMVMKAAACLESLGCWDNLASGKSWNGEGRVPVAGRAPILVCGGVEKAPLVETDKYVFAPGVLSPGQPPVYYRLSAIGGAFVNSFHNFADVRAEECQNYWNRTRSFVRRSFGTRWAATGPDAKSDIEVRFTRLRPDDMCDNAFAIALSSIYFPSAGTILGHCFAEIAMAQETVDTVQTTVDAIGGFDELPRALQLFRVVCACVVLAFAELLAGPEFETLRHVASLDLECSDFLERLARTVNAGLADEKIAKGLPFWQAAALVAAVHAGTDGEAVEMLRHRHRAENANLLGRRAGIFAVVPRLLTDMQPATSAVGLVCLDRLVANVPCDEHGWIRDGTQPLPSFQFSNEPAAADPPSHLAGTVASSSSPCLDLERQDTSSAQTTWPKPSVGPPAVGRPDTSLYLGIERPRHYTAQHVLLTGRVSGHVVAQVTVKDVLRVLLRSISVAACCCPGHDGQPSIDVLNVSTSQWIERNFLHHERWNIFLRTSDDAAWTLFAAGQTAHFGSLIVFGCAKCAQLALRNHPMTGAVPSALIYFGESA